MVQRYTLDIGSNWTKFMDDNGEYVTYADYNKLQKENEALKRWVKEVSAYLNMIHSPTRIARLIKEARELEQGGE